MNEKLSNITELPDQEWRKKYCIIYNPEDTYTHAALFKCNNCGKKPYIRLTLDEIIGKKSIICPLCKK